MNIAKVYIPCRFAAGCLGRPILPDLEPIALKILPQEALRPTGKTEIRRADPYSEPTNH
jgi:hypothetical protein